MSGFEDDVRTELGAAPRSDSLNRNKRLNWTTRAPAGQNFVIQISGGFCAFLHCSLP